MDLSNNLLIVKDNSKRNRKSNAIKLPDGITENMIPKYVVYYKECYNKEKKLYREFFKIEKNPSIKSNKIYTSSKSNKISILDKLEQIKTILLNIETEEIDPEISNTDPSLNIQEITLPKYISLKQTDSKYFFIYDKKQGVNRETIKMSCNNNLTISQNLELFLKKIDEKYNTV
tara:strand:- start:1285 stop:1806 length:522 start_codon:yes stop_codon:yes gene_type:complete